MNLQALVDVVATINEGFPEPLANATRSQGLRRAPGNTKRRGETGWGAGRAPSLRRAMVRTAVHGSERVRCPVAVRQPSTCTWGSSKSWQVLCGVAGRDVHGAYSWILGAWAVPKRSSDVDRSRGLVPNP